MTVQRDPEELEQRGAERFNQDEEQRGVDRDPLGQLSIEGGRRGADEAHEDQRAAERIDQREQG
jgi:hypothetical protein